MMPRPAAFFLDKASLYPDDLDLSVLDSIASWRWFDNATTDDILHELETAEIIVANKVLLSRRVIESCKRLKLICVAATGVNNVDIEAANQHSVKVCNVRGYATSSVVQHVFSLLLSSYRKLPAYNRSALNGDWSQSDFFCFFGPPFSDLEGKTLGIIGYGELGRAVAGVARCFGMNVLVAHSHNKQVVADEADTRVALPVLLAESDVVSLHCPLTEDNRHMISKNELSMMKSDAVLINTARGGLVDEHALLDALQQNQIGAAALDVLAEEPPSPDNALLNYRQDNLLLTPHVAWASRQSRQRLVDEIAKNIQAYLQGEPRNII